MALALLTVAVGLRGSATDARVVSVVATDRHDGDIHPGLVDPPVLRRRQHAATGARWTMLDEVHGSTVIDVDELGGSDRRSALSGVGDVLVSDRAGPHLAVWTADCAPLVLVAADGTMVAAHAGWRGLAAGVVDVAVRSVRRNGADVVAAVLGPLIHPCCYEFGGDDLSTIPFAVPGRTRVGTGALDVAATVRAMLGAVGVDLDVVGPCTGCDERWFSHRVRRDAGRHATIVF